MAAIAGPASLAINLMAATMALVDKTVAHPCLQDRMARASMLMDKITTELNSYKTPVKEEEGRTLFNGAVVMHLTVGASKPEKIVDAARGYFSSAALISSLTSWNLRGRTYLTEFLVEADCDVIKGLLDNASNVEIDFRPALEKHDYSVLIFNDGERLFGPGHL